MYYQLKQLDWGSVPHISLFVEICGRQKGQQGGRVIFRYINVQRSCTKMQRYVDFFALAALSCILWRTVLLLSQLPGYFSAWCQTHTADMLLPILRTRERSAYSTLVGLGEDQPIQKTSLHIHHGKGGDSSWSILCLTEMRLHSQGVGKGRVRSDKCSWFEWTDCWSMHKSSQISVSQPSLGKCRAFSAVRSVSWITI